jgi:hypothetical protein
MWRLNQGISFTKRLLIKFSSSVHQGEHKEESDVHPNKLSQPDEYDGKLPNPLPKEAEKLISDIDEVFQKDVRPGTFRFIFLKRGSTSLKEYVWH